MDAKDTTPAKDPVTPKDPTPLKDHVALLTILTSTVVVLTAAIGVFKYTDGLDRRITALENRSDRYGYERQQFVVVAGKDTTNDEPNKFVVPAGKEDYTRPLNFEIPSGSEIKGVWWSPVNDTAMLSAFYKIDIVKDPKDGRSAILAVRVLQEPSTPSHPRINFHAFYGPIGH